ncbi:MAG: carbon starvation protein A [Deltaproteobacteria bacterium]|jgi:carbon starvation protein CstA|nr:carbon starvation protein A [Deltaproteobacteria bacterium]
MSGGLFFFVCLGLLIGGYFIYGAIVDKVFQPDENRATPAKTMADGVDFVEMPLWKIFLIQLLNIAGLGPVFGPILGALYGPSALLWVVFGCIFAGAVHDYFSGMMSLRYKGKSVPDIVGANLGNAARQFMVFFSVVVLILVGVVFVNGPAGLLSKLTGPSMPIMYWVVIIFIYYFLATMLPIDALIGRIYPIFGAILLFMAISLPIMLFAKGYAVLPNLDFATNTQLDPTKLPIWPLMFITIACGAISGFHATQSPMMARCMANEKLGRKAFYGAMIAEGVIGLVWVTLGLSFYEGAEGLRKALGPTGNASLVVSEVCNTLLGSGFGGTLAILGVVVLPITSGDTAFRSARLTIADLLKMPQHGIVPRLLIAVPLFVIGGVLSQVNFGIIWRYFGWANQTLAMFMLWTAAVYLARRAKFHWICTIPATFMTAVSVTYLCFDRIGFGLSYTVANYIGIGTAVACLVLFLVKGSAPSPVPLEE